MSPNRLILIDGTAVVYRAFFAIPELTAPSGCPTNALFGFIRMLRQLESSWSPTHWAVVFDGGLSQERLTLHEDYKAQRPRMPDPLRSQFEPVQEYLDLARVAWLRIEGEEADDVIASMVVRVEDRADEVLLATSDKDLYQLVGGSCRIIPPAGKGNMMGPEEVVSKTGVPPEKIVEWLALVGDASDNIPGVPGIGPKTAARLLETHGSLEGLWANLDEVRSDRIREALKENRRLLERNVAMVRLRRDIAGGPAWEDMSVKPRDAARLIPFFEEYGLKSMADSLRQADLFEED